MQLPGNESGVLPPLGRPRMGKFSACAPPQKCRRMRKGITSRFPTAHSVGKFVFTTVGRSSLALAVTSLLPTQCFSSSVANRSLHIPPCPPLGPPSISSLTSLLISQRFSSSVPNRALRVPPQLPVSTPFSGSLASVLASRHFFSSPPPCPVVSTSHARTTGSFPFCLAAESQARTATTIHTAASPRACPPWG